MAPSRKALGCPAETTLKILGGRWKLMILRELCGGASRFSELRRGLKGISEKVLTQHLRELEKDGIISRKIYPEIPPKVEYSLTPAGTSLKPIIEAMHEWGAARLSQDAEGRSKI
jgi:DNA-binding HxlR family transcriptional regulator